MLQLGDRVKVTSKYSIFCGYEGEVTKIDCPGWVYVQLDKRTDINLEIGNGLAFFDVDRLSKL